MDPERFDALTRWLGERATRRRTIGGLIGAGLVGVAAATAAGKPHGGKKGQAQPDCAHPGPGKNLNGCDFSGRDFSGKNLSDATMRRTNLRGANLCGANLSSSTLNNADFRGETGLGRRPTNMTRANLRGSTCGGLHSDANTIFCATRMCDGKVRNDGCPAGVDPKDVCCSEDDCGPGRLCQNNVCVPDPGTCRAGQNLCHEGTAPCDNRPDCQCVSTTSGATFCGSRGRCSDCTRDEDCIAVTGPGSVCADYSGDFCSCRETNSRRCVRPCGACTSDQQCNEIEHCCDGVCQECCSSADCRGKETCEAGRCVCQGCRSRINNTCVAGTAWTECGTDGARCAACARGEVCAAGRQSCVNCEAFFDSPAARTWCDAVNHFGEFQCEPNCACAALQDGLSGVCFGGPGYCSSREPICNFSSDCVIEGLGTHCVQLGKCQQGFDCKQTVCVTKCGTGPWGKDTSPADGPPRIVVLDRDARP
jgi:hypothetical protein